MPRPPATGASARPAGQRRGLDPRDLDVRRLDPRGLDVRVGDIVCVVMLVAATLVLFGSDGGREPQAMWPVLLAGLAVLAATAPTLRHQSTLLLGLAALWAIAPVAALAFAEVRAGFVRPVTAWAIAVPTLLATLHLLRRPWGRTAVVAIVGIALARAWYGGLLAWWGGASARGEPAWMALSWHNQSGTLMGVLGVGGLGLALVRRGPARAVGVAAATAGLSAAWLSGSRGAVAATALAVLVVLGAAVRRGTDRRLWLTLATTAAAVAAAVVVLGPVYGAASGTADAPGGLDAAPVTAREQGAADNLRARVGHWQAAGRMFLAAPATGAGPGAYEWSSVPVYPDDVNLTASAHNEYLEAFAELGLLGGTALLGAGLWLAWLVLAVLRRPGPHPIELAAAGVVTLLAGHAAVDFDFDYPVLLVLLAVGAGVLIHARSTPATTAGRASADPAPDPVIDPAADPAADRAAPPPDTHRRSGRWLVVSTIAAASCLIVTALAGLAVERAGSPPWRFADRLPTAVELASDDPAAAGAQLDPVRAWNPGAPRLAAVELLVDHASGELTDAELAAAIDPDDTPLAEQVQAARQLLGAGRPDLAESLAQQLRPVLDRRQAWGVEATVVEVAHLLLAAAHEHGGCEAVRSSWPAVSAWLADHGLDADTVAGEGPWSPCELEPGS